MEPENKVFSQPIKVRYARIENTRAKLPSYLRTEGKLVGFNRVIRAIILEYLATALFVFYACGSVVAAQVYQLDAVTTVAQNLFAAIVQGFAIAMLVYAISHTSGGHINPAVTLALMISGNIGLIRGIFYIISQLLGGITGAALLSAFVPGRVEGNLGTTNISQGVSPFQGYLFEFLITFALLFTIFGTALNKEAAASGTSSLAPLPIGFSITVGVGIAFQFTGGSMNPARTFGPAVISHSWSHHYIYWFGPFTASLLVGLLERFFALFSQGQHAVFRAVAIRKRKEIREATANASKKAPSRRPSVVNAVPVVLEPGTEPVAMIPMVNPDHPDRPFMVPVATQEQLDIIDDNDPDNDTRITPRSPMLAPTHHDRKRSVFDGRRRSHVQPGVQFTEPSPSNLRQRTSTSQSPSSPRGFNFKRKLSLVPPAPLSDFGYLSDVSLEEEPIDRIRPISAPPTTEAPANIPVTIMPQPSSPSVNSPHFRNKQREGGSGS